ncbi:MAG: protein-glutamate O-methyltransferase CheR [Pseudomonadota bacterium]
MKKETGMVISEDKHYIIATKLYPILVKYHHKDLKSLADETRNNRELIQDIIDTLLVNETFFYRDKYLFSALDKYILPEKINSQKLNILCAACSSGQEPYSIVMHFLEHYNNMFEFNILGIDVSYSILDKARQGTYNNFEVQRGLPKELLDKYFIQNGDEWVIKDLVKKNVTFLHANIGENLSRLGKFDIVFCRNVLIYFNQDFREKVINNLTNAMNPDAVLILGSAESVLSKNDNLCKFTPYPGIYKYVTNPDYLIQKYP